MRLQHMITKDTARLVYNCYYEIEQAEKLIEEMQKALDENGNLKLKDIWNSERGHMELHIPSGRGSHYIKGFPADMSLQIIQMHIENQKKELERLKGVCKIQLA